MPSNLVRSYTTLLNSYDSYSGPSWSQASARAVAADCLKVLTPGRVRTGVAAPFADQRVMFGYRTRPRRL